MFELFQDKNSIVKIITSLPSELVNNFDKKEYYSPEEVKSVFLKVLGTEQHIEYAYAMFCSQLDFNELTKVQPFDLPYSKLRLAVSKKCFEGWPRFNFESLLNYSEHSVISDLVNEVSDIGTDIVGGF